MILIQSQLWSIDQSDLFIPKSGEKSIQHLLLFFSILPHYFPAYLSSGGCSRSAHVCLYNTYSEQNDAPVKSTDPGTQGNLSSQPDTSKFFCSQACCISLPLRLFGFFFYDSHLRNPLPSTPPPPTPRLASSAARHPGHVKTQTQRQVTKTGPDFPAHQWKAPGWEPS